MINSGRSFASSDRPRLATLEMHEDLIRGFRRRRNQKPAKRMGWTRAILSAASICLGLGATFIALHYVPAHLSPGHFIRISDMDKKVIEDQAEGVLKVLSPYWDSLQTRRTYVWAGETVDIHYTLQGDEHLQLVVKRCASQIVIEVFACNVEDQQIFPVSSKRGRQRLTFRQSGFYHFDEIQKGDARVIWRRQQA